METQTLEPEIIPTTELEKINATDVALAQLLQKAHELAAIGTPDKAAYNEIHAFTMVAVDVRTASLKLAKAQAAPYGEKYDAIMAEGKRIGEEARKAENLTRPLKMAYEAEQERIKEEAAKAEAARIAARIDSLYKLGATFDGLAYNVHGVLIDAIEVKALPGEEYDDLYQSAYAAYNTEQTRLAQIEEQRQQEVARLEQQRQEQEAERVRLKTIADQQEADRLAMERDWAELKRQREQAERDEAARLQKIVDDEEAERLRVESEAQEAQRAIAQKQAEADKKKADTARSKRLAPDKKKLTEYIDSLENMAEPVVSEPEAREVVSAFGGWLQILIADMREEIKSL